MPDDRLSESTKAALRERVKELKCLYGIAQIAGRPGAPLSTILREIVEVLPPAWQYPQITCARVEVDGAAHITPDFKHGFQSLTADIVVNGLRRGFVEIAYTEQKPELDEGPFLQEERNLIEEVARQIGLIIERKQAEEDRSRLHAQLRHADRLATVGMLAAGVAHELNEPLGNILGFAQLAKKCGDAPVSVKQDMEKIETASLYARSIIQKLLVFARQIPPEKRPVSLNEVVADGLFFFEARCVKEGIKLVRVLCPDLPEIVADPVQWNQVVVNLVVNAVQSMDGGGGRITVQTAFDGSEVSLMVEDDGSGMKKAVLDRIFEPFFSTKDVGHGTGLGLSVVHGIVTAHGGSIKVESKIKQGTRFEIRIPAAPTHQTREGR